MTSFRITGVSPSRVAHLFGLTDVELAAQNVRRYSVDTKPGFPDRIELRDLEVGETALLLNYTHLDADSPYRSSHAIFVREGAASAYDRVDEIPDVLRCRLLSVRAFDRASMIVDADVIPGDDLRGWIERMFADSGIDFIDVHSAKRGCYIARVHRA